MISPDGPTRPLPIPINWNMRPDFPLTFDIAGWRDGRDNLWVNADSDTLALSYHPEPPDVPVSSAAVDELRRVRLRKHAQNGFGLVELDILQVDGLDTLAEIVKGHLDSPGVAYRVTLTVPRAQCSITADAVCYERGITGIRDSVVLARFLNRADSALPLDEMLAPFYAHPFDDDFEMRTGSPRNQSDDQRWDAEFPAHPLSRARRILAELVHSGRLDSAFKELPPFHGAGRPRLVVGPEVHYLARGITTIGQAADADVRISDPAAARARIEIHWDGTDAVLTDHTPAGDTVVQGIRVRTWLLKDGDSIRIGRSVLTFRSQPE